MILKDLIDIYYSPNIINNKNKYNKIKESINSIKIDNILNINENIRQKFFIIVTENNYRIKTTLDPILEQYISEDIDSNNINNITNILESISPNLVNVLLELDNSVTSSLEANYDTEEGEIDTGEGEIDIEEGEIDIEEGEIDTEEGEIEMEMISPSILDDEDESNISIHELSDESHLDLADEVDNEYDTFAESDTSEQEVIDEEELYKSNIVYDLYTHKYIQLHLFQKKYNSKYNVWTKSKIKYLITLFFNDKLKIDCEFSDLDISALSTDDQENLQSKICDIDFYYKKSYHFYDDLQYIYNFINTYAIFNNTIFDKLPYISTGLYFNKDDILWQIFLCKLITSTETFNIKYIDNSYYTQYQYLGITEAYFPNYQANTASFFENCIIKDHSLICDKCQTLITTSKFYNNHNFGDLCIDCYNNKKAQGILRIKYLWRLVLLQGKKNIFQKELETTRLFLEKTRIKKMPRRKYYTLLENTTHALLEKNSDIKKICRICLDKMSDNIVTGSLCGHCFHADCIKAMGKNNCPYCRKNTNFIKIYF